MTTRMINSSAFRRGFRAMLPLWLGAIPFAIAYAIAAQKAGLSPLETQLMSLTVSSAAAQMGIVQLLAVGAAPLAIILTAVALSLHHVLYGLSLSKRMKLSWLDKATTAYFLTDAAYGLIIAHESNETSAFLLGAELSMFVVWNLFTAFGVLLGHIITIPADAHLDFVAPMTFFVLLVSLTKTRLALAVAIIAAAITWICLTLQLGSATVFIAGLGGAFMGALLAERRSLPESAVGSTS